MNEKDLSKYYWLKQEVNDLEENIRKVKNEIKEFGDGVGSSKFKDIVTSSSGVSESIQEKYMKLKEKLETLQNIHIEKRLSALEEYIKIENYISSVEEPLIRLIMRKRFLDLKQFEEIGKELKYERTSISKMMRKYLKNNFPTIPMKK